MTDDDIWGRTRENRRATADRLMTGLRLDVDHSDPPEVQERKARERAAKLEAHDRMFAPGYVTAGGRLMSTELATKLGYEISRPAFTAASDPEDGEMDDYRRD
jgi:hypothetical protein